VSVETLGRMRRITLRLVASVSLIAALAVVPGPASGADAYAGYINDHTYVQTRYGSIYVQYWKPLRGRAPVLLSMSPYRYLYGYLDPTGRVDPMKDYYSNTYVPRGYARAYADLLGTGYSDGCWDYGGAKEAEAGAAVVEWLAAQPWSTGKIGMIGTSYDGAIQLETAALAPPHLAAIVPQEPVSSWYHYNYEAAVTHNSTDDDVGLADTGYPIGTPDLFDLVLSRTPNTDPNRSPQAHAANVADRASECEAIEHNYRGHIADPSYGSFWQERDWSLRASRVRAAVLLQHGWRDYNTKPDQFWRFWTALPRTLDKRVLLGRWNHTDVFAGAPSYATPPINSAKYLAAFLDVHLKGKSPTLLARFPRILTEGSDEVWRTTLPAALRPTTWRFGEDASFVNSGMETSKIFKNLPGGMATPAMAVWATPTFRKPARIVGPGFVAATTAVMGLRGQLDATLLDVDPSGAAKVLTLGLADLRYYEDPAAPHSLEPGEAMSVRVRLRPIDAVVAAGHHLEVVLAGSEAMWGVPDPEVGQQYTLSHVTLSMPITTTGNVYRR
jgi:predicted acyl esterase